jgi:hypothetical protein
MVNIKPKEHVKNKILRVVVCPTDQVAVTRLSTVTGLSISALVNLAADRILENYKDMGVQ